MCFHIKSKYEAHFNFDVTINIFFTLKLLHNVIRNKYLQGIVCERRGFWWFITMKMTVKYIETKYTHIYTRNTHFCNHSDELTIHYNISKRALSCLVFVFSLHNSWPPYWTISRTNLDSARDLHVL